MPRPDLEPFTPGKACPACQAESAQPHYHARPVLVVFGSEPQWPCSGKDGEMDAHMCTRCRSCGYAWTEAVPSGMDAVTP